MEIKIKKVDKKFAQSGSPYLLITAETDGEDKIMSCWDVNLFKMLDVGAHLDVEVEIKGQYTTIQGVTTTSKIGAPKTLQASVAQDLRQNSIEAQVILKCVADAGVQKPWKDVQEMITYADNLIEVLKYAKTKL